MKNIYILIFRNLVLILTFSFLKGYALFFDATTTAGASIFPTDLTCEYRNNPLGIDVPQPRLSWQFKTDHPDIRAQRQTAWQIVAASRLEYLEQGQGDLWDSGKIESEKQLHIIYQGENLKSGLRVYWKVRTWDKKDSMSEWSEPAFWEMGLLTPADWGTAQWIAFEELDESDQIVPGIPHTKDKGLPRNILPQFRKEFFISKSIQNATLFISGLGQYELSLNGEKVGDYFLDPGWTNYRTTCLFAAYDITKQLKEGANAIGVLLGNGMFFIPQERYLKHVIAFSYPQMILKLLLRYADGRVQEIVSDESFKVSQSPITFSSIFGGEDYDATLEQEGWDQPGFDDSKWQKPVFVKGPGGELRAQSAPPLKIMESFKPIKITEPAKNVWIYDMGQNVSGIPEITVKGKTGAVVKITPGELLSEKGVVTQKATGSPCYFSYTLNGKGVETWQPRFTYYGFRYVQVEGAVPVGEENPSNLPVIKNLKSLHTRNSAQRVGDFSCSNDLFNRIYRLIDWAIKSNMASVLTDCPHREKLGWLEQAHLMAASIRYIYDVPVLFAKIVQDMKEAQLDNGLIPDIAPEYPVFSKGFRDSPEWGSAYVILPWYLYKWYGDIRPIQEHYEGMKRYTNYLSTTATNFIVSHGLGDWFDLGPKNPGPAQLTPKALSATAIYYYDVTILEKAALLLGKENDVQKYRELGESIRLAFNNKFFNKEKNLYSTGSQTANAMAIFMGLVEPQYKPKVLEKLVKNIRARNNSLTAGDIGFRYLIRTLESGGFSDVIYDMNSRTDVPGYGYQLSKGATSLTESWQAYPNVSNNHMMLGHVMEWFYSGLAGIQIDLSATGYEQIIIKPEIVGDLTWVKGEYNSLYGKIKCSWQLNGNILRMQVTIPLNTVATIYVPTADLESVTESGKPAAGADGVEFQNIENGRADYYIGSGSYSFESKI